MLKIEEFPHVVYRLFMQITFSKYRNICFRCTYLSYLAILKEAYARALHLAGAGEGGPGFLYTPFIYHLTDM